MPRGRRVNHKGRSRNFTNPEALEEERKREEKQKEYREKKRQALGEGDSSEEEDERAKNRSGSEDSDSDEETDSETESKGKGVEKLIEISNPNRAQNPRTHKMSTLNETLTSEAKPELSRREKEELKKQAARARYQKLHAEGRTKEAIADLARLSIIKAQREEAAQKRQLEKLQKEEQLKSKQEAVNKALGKKT